MVEEGAGRSSGVLRGWGPGTGTDGLGSGTNARVERSAVEQSMAT